MKARKRNGVEVDFNLNKIINAIKKANNAVEEKFRLNEDKIAKVVATVQKYIEPFSTVKVEDIQDFVEKALVKHNCYEVSKAYILYRNEKLKSKKFSPFDEKILSIVNATNEDIAGDNANKSPTVLSAQRDYIAGTACKFVAEKILPKDILEAHKKKIIHFHDLDYSPIMHMSNCCLVNLKDMFENGFMLNQVMIKEPKSFKTACNLAAQIAMAVASSQYGGQTLSWGHIAKYIDVSRQKIRKEVIQDYETISNDFEIDNDKIEEVVNRRLLKEIKDGVQTLQYQLLTLITSNGQTPFVSMAIDFNDCENENHKKDLALVVEEVLKQRMEGIENEQGVKRPVLFPKILYVTDEGINIRNDDPYFYLTELAAECTTKAMVPDYISAKKSREIKNGQVIKCMGCRSFLADFIDPETKEHKSWGRFNQGVVTLNLPYVALESKRDNKDFWELLDERLELCHRALLIRHESLKGVKAKTAPILWQWGALTRLGPEDVIDPYLFNGYSSISLGYIGLYETCQALLGKSNTTEEGKKLSYKILDYMNKKCEEWKKQLDIGWSIYGTPEESLTDKAAQALKRDFGLIENVTDHDYVTNSYHVNPAEPIDAFSKLSFEGEMLKKSTGGAVSYVEVAPSIRKNLPAVISLIQYMYDNILYAEMNTKFDYCYECHSQAELALDTRWGKMLFTCPVCGNHDQTKLSAIRRVCGYLGEAARGINENSTNMNEGRKADLKARYVHL